MKGVSFQIQPGELVGFLGPNGAGKTTTLKMLSGILYPTSGQARILGYTPWERKNGYLKRISLVMGQKNQLWWDLPALDSFRPCCAKSTRCPKPIIKSAWTISPRF